MLRYNASSHRRFSAVGKSLLCVSSSVCLSFQVPASRLLQMWQECSSDAHFAIWGWFLYFSKIQRWKICLPHFSCWRYRIGESVRLHLLFYYVPSLIEFYGQQMRFNSLGEQLQQNSRSRGSFALEICYEECCTFWKSTRCQLWLSLTNIHGLFPVAPHNWF